MIGKRLINTGVAAADALVPSENFNTVLYTGNGSTQRIGGYINRGAVFNGSSSYISLANADSILGNPAGQSISVWANFNSVTTSGFNSTVLLASNNGVGAADWQITLYDGKIYADYFDAAGAYRQRIGSTVLSANTWYHFVIVFDSTNSDIIQCYVNGSAETMTNQTSGGTFSGNIDNSSIPITIGRRDLAGGSWYMNGKIDQIRIFNKALSSSEVTTLYGETHASTTISTTDIFNDNSGVALYQLDGNANDTGGVSGKFGSGAIIKNGGYITHSLTAPTTLSYSLWVKPNSFSVNSWDSTDFFIIGTGADLGIGGLMLRSKSDGYPTFNRASNVGGAITSNTAMNLSQWNHIVVTYSNGVDVKIYLNNVEVADSSFSTTQTSTISAGSANFFGAFATSVYNVGDFIIDDLRVYHDILTSTEVGYLYNNTTASIPTDNLVAYYKFDGDARDEQQLYDGTVTNVTYAYDGTATNVTYQEATNFQPDLVWIKRRSSTEDHAWFDSVRGIQRQISSNLTAAGYTTTNAVSSFDSNGFTTGNNGATNASSQTYVAWCFKGGGTAVSNTDGTLTSQVSANQAAGFSIVKWTGDGTNASIGHGLSSTPEMVIVKPLDSQSLGNDWKVYHSALGSLKVIYLNLTVTPDNAPSSFWGTIDSTTFGQGGADISYLNINNNDYIAYCFHSVDGYSKIGSYTGNGSTSGPIVETGFEPAWIMIKSSSTTAHWNIVDNKRDTSNPATQRLFANLSNAESAGINVLDFTSNGFQIKNSDVGFNGNTETYIYLAIAADPDTTTPTVENSFDVVTYTGTGSTQEIDTDFKPDLVWIKNRDAAHNHILFDSVRGDGNSNGYYDRIMSNTTDAQQDTITDAISSLDSNSFTVVSAGSGSQVNNTNDDYVAWVWKAGDHDDNLPQINTEGTIDSVVSVNAAAGFSIIKVTAPASGSFTYGHGLSSAPEFFMTKSLSSANWQGWHNGLSNSTNAIFLNLTSGENSSYNFWNAAPTSTVLSGNSGVGFVANEEHIIYAFHSVSGYQKIGSYTGNGTSVSSTNTITTGFQPRWIMFKCTTAADQWIIFDNARGTVANVTDTYLLANSSQAEADLNDGNQVEFLSNGFKITGNGRYFNQNSETYIYLAIK